jgi:hypothetical protein
MICTQPGGIQQVRTMSNEMISQNEAMIWKEKAQFILSHPSRWEQTGEWIPLGFTGLFPDEILADILLQSITVPEGWSRKDHVEADETFEAREILLEDEQYAVRIWTTWSEDQQFAGVHFFRKDRRVPEYDEAISIATPLFGGKIALTHGGLPPVHPGDPHQDAYNEVRTDPDAPFGFALITDDVSPDEPDKHYAIKLHPIPAFRGRVE